MMINDLESKEQQEKNRVTNDDNGDSSIISQAESATGLFEIKVCINI